MVLLEDGRALEQQLQALQHQLHTLHQHRSQEATAETAESSKTKKESNIYVFYAQNIKTSDLFDKVKDMSINAIYSITDRYRTIYSEFRRRHVTRKMGISIAIFTHTCVVLQKKRSPLPFVLVFFVLQKSEISRIALSMFQSIGSNLAIRNPKSECFNP